MHNSWVSPRVRQAIDQLATDRQRLVREYQQLAASYEDGTAGRGKDSWLAAKHYEHFASYLANYDSTGPYVSLWERATLYINSEEDRKWKEWHRWRRFLRKRA